MTAPSTFTADEPALPMHYPGFIFRTLRAEGYRTEALIAGTKLKAESFEDPYFRANFSTVRRFVLNAVEISGDPHLGLRLAAKFRSTFAGPPAYAAMSAPSFVEGLEILERFLFLSFPLFAFSYAVFENDHNREKIEVYVRPILPLQDIEIFSVTSALSVVRNLLFEMVGPRLPISRIETTISKPGGWDELNAETRLSPITFQCSKNAILIEDAFKDHPLPGADAINFKRMTGLCEEFASQSEYKSTAVSEVMAFLRQQGGFQQSFAEIAAAMGYSERGLRRKLERSGTSYRALLNKAKENRARNMLIRTNRPIQDIAIELGYETASNFTRSFKRWTGVTPKTFREDHAAVVSD